MRKQQNTKTEKRLYRYADLEAIGIVSNRPTLSRWIKSGRFPAPIQLGPNSVAWIADEVDSHLKQLAREREVTA